MEDLAKDIASIKEQTREIMNLNKTMKVPLGLKKLVVNAFTCKICNKSPVQPPVIVAKCCKAILGCEECVNNHFSGEQALTKSCPNCNARRGNNETMLLRGLDDFLIEMKSIIGEQEEDTE